MASAGSPNTNADTELVDNDQNPNPNSSNVLVPESGSPAVCLLRFAGDSAGGAFMGSIFGYGLLSHPY